MSLPLLHKTRDSSWKKYFTRTYKNLQEPQKNAQNVKKRVFFVFLGVKQGPKKRAFFGPFLALFTLLNWPKNPTFRKMHEKQGVTGGSKKTSFFVFFCDFLQKIKKYFIDHWRVEWELDESGWCCVREMRVFRESAQEHEKMLFFSNPEEGVQRALFSGFCCKKSNRGHESWWCWRL